jgi:hypothetical protein
MIRCPEYGRTLSAEDTLSVVQYVSDNWPDASPRAAVQLVGIMAAVPSLKWLDYLEELTRADERSQHRQKLDVLASNESLVRARVADVLAEDGSNR